MNITSRLISTISLVISSLALAIALYRLLR